MVYLVGFLAGVAIGIAVGLVFGIGEAEARPDRRWGGGS